ncbi:hypothetical protein BVG19_g325 [[Candida] boidinii]|nr:hypothetical protein BVG19_g325 [[Candida] boidinii]OWB49514.1 hypothetical protein B5S27_g1055 [[Candida] boidinii]
MSSLNKSLGFSGKGNASRGGGGGNNDNGKNFNKKRTKLYNSRLIRSEQSDPAFTNAVQLKNELDNTKKFSKKDILNRDNIPNKLDIPSFLNSRKYEIKEFQNSQFRSKNSSSTRVFQSLPRSMRRRTASHNVRRIPKRMRKKALKEMGLSLNSSNYNNNNYNDDGSARLETKGVTATGKPVKDKHPRGRILYKLRREMKLLKYAGKYKLSGNLISGEIINASKINLRKRLKYLKNEIDRIENERSEINIDDIDGIDNTNDIDNNIDDLDPNCLKFKDITNNKIFSKLLNNKSGSFDNTSISRFNSPLNSKVYSMRYATRQKKYKWTPTHRWFAKRAKMIKRWGWQIANEPTMKSFRQTSRSSRVKGGMAWDTTYINTMIINCDYSSESVGNGKVVSKEELIEIIGTFSNSRAIKPKYFKRGNYWEGLIYSINGNATNDNELLGRGLIIWNCEPSSSTSSSKIIKCMVRVHPSLYERVFNEFTNKFKDYDNLTIHDCKYSIGSILVNGPKSLSSLESIFHLVNQNTDTKSYKIWRDFANLQDINTLPIGSMFSFYINDPRFWLKGVKPSYFSKTDQIMDSIIKVSNGEGVNSESFNDLFSVQGRSKSYENQASLKEIAKRRSPVISGENIKVNEDKDPLIPIIIMRLEQGLQVLLPWFWVLPLSFTLFHIPHINIGGLKNIQQLNFENFRLDFLNDYHFTDIGYTENEIKKFEKFKKWNRKPKSKKILYDKIIINNKNNNNGHDDVDDDVIGEIGNPFCSDWRFLQVLRHGLKLLKFYETSNGVQDVSKSTTNFNESLNREIKTFNDLNQVIKDIEKADELLLDKAGHTALKELPIRLYNKKSIGLINDQAEKISSAFMDFKNIPQLFVKPIKFKCISRGHPSDNARIYMIPQEDRQDWINYYKNYNKNIYNHNNSPKLDNLFCPSSRNLIGFATSATFNLTVGCGAGVGSIAADAFPLVTDDKSGLTQENLVIIRNIGSDTPMLASFEYVKL